MADNRSGDYLKTKVAQVVQSLIVGDDEAFQELLGEIAAGETVTCTAVGQLHTKITVTNPLSHRPRTFMVQVKESR